MAVRDLYTFESGAIIRLKSAALRRVYRHHVVGSISVLYNIHIYLQTGWAETRNFIRAHTAAHLNTYRYTHINKSSTIKLIYLIVMRGGGVENAQSGVHPAVEGVLCAQ